MWVWESADGNKNLKSYWSQGSGSGQNGLGREVASGFVFDSKTAFGCPVRGQWKNCMRDGSPVGFLC